MDFSNDFILAAFDTETTGLDTTKAHRVVDLAFVLLHWSAQRKKFEPLAKHQWYVNPERASDPGAARVHRLSKQFLAKQYLMKDVLAHVLSWMRTETKKIPDVPIYLLAHNARFDIGFMNTEAKLLNLSDPFYVLCGATGAVDTKRVYQLLDSYATKASQDAFCEWVGVDVSNRVAMDGNAGHGALVDTWLLAQAVNKAVEKVGVEQLAAAFEQSLLDEATLFSTDSTGNAHYQRPKNFNTQASSPKRAAMKEPTESSPAKTAVLQALQQAKASGERIGGFIARLQSAGIGLRLNFADEYRKITGTAYVIDGQTYSGSSLDKPCTAGALMEAFGYERLADADGVYECLPLQERLMRASYEDLQDLLKPNQSAAPSILFPDDQHMCMHLLWGQFAHATSIYTAIRAHMASKEAAASWLESSRAVPAIKTWADGVALFLNGFSFAAKAQKHEGVEPVLASLREKVARGETISELCELALLHEGAMLICEKAL